MHFEKATFLVAFAASASAYSATSGSFAVNRFYGKGPLTIGRMDPIVNPGTASGHVHAIQGGNGFDITMTNYQAYKSTCTSSLVKADRSNYWTPSLYFQDPKTKLLEAVEWNYMNVYYFFDQTTDVITAFPPGLRIVAGNPNLRTPPKTGGLMIDDLKNGDAQPVQWMCARQDTSQPLYPTNSDGLHGVGIQDPTNGGMGVGFSDKECDGLYTPMRANVYFPNCWNNATDASLVNDDNPKGYKYLDTFVNKEAITWTTDMTCPSDFTHLPRLFYEVYWTTDVFAGRWTPGQGNQPWVLSNGDPTGYGLHGDFIAGWDEEILTTVINGCNTGDGGMDKCPGVGPINDDSTSCNIADKIPETLLKTGMTALPGNNPIGQWGVNVAGSAPAAPAGGSSAVSPVASSTAAGAGETTLVSSSTAAGPTSVSGVVASAQPPANAPASSSMDSPATTLSTTTIQTTTVSGTASTSTATPSSTSNGSSTVADGWSYSGCYQDDNARVLTGITFANVGQHAVTNTKCIAYCQQRGFSMAGTEYGGQCFCGNSMSTETKLDDSKCSMACEGDGSQTCGGSNALSVYSQSSPKYARALGRHVRALGHLRRHIS